MKVLKNYLYNLTYQMLAIVLPIVTIPYVSRILGPSGLGIYALSGTYAQYFVIVGMLGLATYSSREIAYVKDDYEKLSRTFWEINLLEIITVGLALIFYICIFGFILNIRYRLIYILQTLVIISNIIDISWLFIGLENFKKVVIKNTLVKVIGVMLIFIFIKKSSQVWLYTLLLGGMQVIGQVTMWFDIPKNIRFILPNKKNMIRHLKYSIRLFLPQIAITVYTMLDKVMLGVLSTESQVGMYDNSQRIIKTLITVVTALATVTIPRMSNLFYNRRIKEFKNNVYKSFSFVSFVSIPMTFGLISVSDSFVPLFFGDAFNGIIPMFYVGSLLMITLGWSSILGNQVLISIKREKQFTISVTVGSIINIIFNCILIRKYGGVGTTIASVMAEYIGMFLMAYFSKDILDIKKLFGLSIKYFTASLIMFFVLLIFNLDMNITFMMKTCIKIIVGFIVYFGIMVLIKDQNLLYLFEFGKNKLSVNKSVE